MRWPVWLLSIALSASAATSWWLWRELQTERQESSVVRSRLEQLADHVANPSASPPQSPSVDTPEANLPAVSSATASVVSMNPGPEKGANPGRDEFEHFRERQRKLLAEPGYREAWRAQRRLSLASRRGNLIRLVGLTPAAADAVIEVMIDQQMAQEHRSFSGTEEQRKLMIDKTVAEDRSFEEKIRALIGPGEYPRYEQ